MHKAFDALKPVGALLGHDRMPDNEPKHAGNPVIGLDILLVTDGGPENPAV
ncbi:hypothetical protein [Streptomyces hygroscopicus]|uniref:hypothetical protein n=1 Tax=Streptomyces hygroscopicus TaxID=1912 RepID=UPI00223F1CFD|nr:hypothetical protein [Streptomyces hygroscopicus]